MPAILQVPQELWQTILPLLDRRSIRALNQTCWSLHGHTLPALYFEIRPPFFKSDKHIARWLDRLLLTLFVRPEVRELVRCIDLTFTGHSEYILSVDPSPSKLTGLKLQWDIHVIRSMLLFVRDRPDLFPDPATICDSVQRCYPDAIVAVIIAMFPNLGALSLAASFLDSRSQFVAPLLARMGKLWRTEKQAPLFGKLEAFESSDFRSGRGYWPSWDAVKALFYFPKLKSLSTILPCPWDWSWPENIVPASPITRIHLLNSQIKPNRLAQILVACPNLEGFHFEAAVLTNLPTDAEDVIDDKHCNWKDMYGCSMKRHPDWKADAHSHPCYLSLTELITSIQPSTTTLKEFALRLRPIFISPTMPHESDVASMCRGNMRGLKSFKSLQTLDVSTDILGFDDLREDGHLGVVIPKTLNRLYVGIWNHESCETHWDPASVTEALEDLLEEKQLSKDCEIAIVDDGVSRLEQTVIAQLIALCRKHSIAYSLHMEDSTSLMDREALGVWTAEWHHKLRGVADLENYWRKGLRTCQRDGDDCPSWLTLYASTLSEESFEELSDGDVFLPQFDEEAGGGVWFDGDALDSFDTDSFRSYDPEVEWRHMIPVAHDDFEPYSPFSDDIDI